MTPTKRPSTDVPSAPVKRIRIDQLQDDLDAHVRINQRLVEHNNRLRQEILDLRAEVARLTILSFRPRLPAFIDLSETTDEETSDSDSDFEFNEIPDDILDLLDNE